VQGFQTLPPEHTPDRAGTEIALTRFSMPTNHLQAALQIIAKFRRTEH
jgi:hypothetical protein